VVAVAPIDPSFTRAYRHRQPDWGFNGLGYVVYKRTYARRLPSGRAEEWVDTLTRVVDGAQAIGAGLEPAEAASLFDHAFNLRALPGGRLLWQLGTANNTRLGGDSLVNCWWTLLRAPADFGFLMNQLMLGGGVGFSVRAADVAALPPVRPAAGPLVTEVALGEADEVVADTREGWAQLVVRLLETYLGQRPPFAFSAALVRPAGAPIRTFGGTAAGPGVLLDGVRRLQEILLARAGRRLRPVDVLDLANVLGHVVVAGNVRRSAQIAIGDPGDREFLAAKRWAAGAPAWRAMSNNTVAAGHPDDLGDEFWEDYLGEGEPYGLLNLEAARTWGRAGEARPDPDVTGVNPCAEVPLAHHEPCNLAELFLPRLASLEQAWEAAAGLYKVQKAVAALPYLDPVTREVVGRHRRLGLSVSGTAQATPEQLSWLPVLYERLRALDRAWSEKRDWPESIRLTTVKPSGTLSLLAGVTPGCHPGFARFHVRRLRLAADDPLVGYCERLGLPPAEADLVVPRTAVVEFPAALPAGTWTIDGRAEPIRQLEHQLWLQRHWADNAVSASTYFDPEQLPEVQAWLRRHWGELKTVSFFRRAGHGFAQAPLEAIDELEYARRRAALRPAEAPGEAGIGDGPLEVAGCEAGACPAR